MWGLRVEGLAWWEVTWWIHLPKTSLGPALAKAGATLCGEVRQYVMAT